jgi:hypothetical protein
VGVRTLPGTPALALLAITGGLMAALLSETRSAWAALPLMSIAVLIMPGRRPIPRRWVLAGVVSAVLAALLASELVGARLGEGIAEVRAYLANPARQAPAKPPRAPAELAVGLGAVSGQPGVRHRPGNFRSAVAAAVTAGTLPPILTTLGGLHNLFIDHLTTTGLVGTRPCWPSGPAPWAIRRGTAQPGCGQAPVCHLGLVLLIGELVFSTWGRCLPRPSAPSVSACCWRCLRPAPIRPRRHGPNGSGPQAPGSQQAAQLEGVEAQLEATAGAYLEDLRAGTARPA